MTDFQERRGARRVDATLSLQVSLPDGVSTLETINISSSGLYFRSTRFMEPMTKLAMELEVAVPDAEAPARVPCEGLVVRTTPDVPQAGCDDYEVAVFFTYIEPEGREIFERHLAMLLEAGT